MVNLSDWSLEELQKIADHFEESLESLVANQDVSDVSTTFKPAMTHIGGALCSCKAQIGGRAPDGLEGRLVALKTPMASGAVSWLVVPSEEAFDKEAFEVGDVVLDGSNRNPKRIAVLDDDQDLALSLVQYLNAAGFDGTAFYTTDTLSDAMTLVSFDGYIIDWLINRVPSAELIGAIRAANPTCPIFLLTGHTLEDDLESDLARVSSLHRLQYLQKPVKSLELTSALGSAFAR